jgi:hypothetical protein
MPDGRRPGAVVSLMRFVGRYAIATAMIPVGVALGVGGLVQFAWRQRRARRAARAHGGGAPGVR